MELGPDGVPCGLNLRPRGLECWHDVGLEPFNDDGHGGFDLCPCGVHGGAESLIVLVKRYEDRDQGGNCGYHEEDRISCHGCIECRPCGLSCADDRLDLVEGLEACHECPDDGGGGSNGGAELLEECDDAGHGGRDRRGEPVNEGLEAGAYLGLEDVGGLLDLRDDVGLDAGGEVLEGRNCDVLCPRRKRFECGHEVVKGGGRERGHHGKDQCPCLGCEVAEVGFEDLHLMREGVAFAGEGPVRVGGLLHNQGQCRGLLRLVIE